MKHKNIVQKALTSLLLLFASSTSLAQSWQLQEIEYLAHSQLAQHKTQARTYANTLQNQLYSSVSTESEKLFSNLENDLYVMSGDMFKQQREYREHRVTLAEEPIHLQLVGNSHGADVSMQLPDMHLKAKFSRVVMVFFKINCYLTIRLKDPTVIASLDVNSSVVYNTRVTSKPEHVLNCSNGNLPIIGNLIANKVEKIAGDMLAQKLNPLRSSVGMSIGSGQMLIMQAFKDGSFVAGGHDISKYLRLGAKSLLKNNQMRLALYRPLRRPNFSSYKGQVASVHEVLMQLEVTRESIFLQLDSQKRFLGVPSVAERSPASTSVEFER